MRRAVITTSEPQTLQKIINFNISLQSLKLFNVSGVTKDTKGTADGSDTNKLSQGDDVTNKESHVVFWLQILYALKQILVHLQLTVKVRLCYHFKVPDRRLVRLHRLSVTAVTFRQLQHLRFVTAAFKLQRIHL